MIWRCWGNRAEINRRANFDAEAFEACPIAAADGTIASLRALMGESRIDIPTGLPPMASGLVGYLGYDMVRLVERLPDRNPDILGVPDGMMLRPTVMAVFDTIQGTVTVITPVWREPDVAADAAYDRALERLVGVVGDFDRSVPHRHDAAACAGEFPVPTSNTGRGGYHTMVEKAKEYILAGDIFQVVPSQRFAIPFALPPFALYRALRRLNPSPFLFFLDLGRFSIVGSSPEILVRVRAGKVTIRPIAGTRPRGKTPAEDRALADDLLSDPKELAEHLMLLDLGRNDVGRVAVVGTVHVTERNVIEHYSHVMHIVSNVEGVLDSRYDVLDALLAGFPAGTVSGAPRCAPWRSSTNSSRTGAVSTPVASVTSAPTAIWIRVSRSAPRSSRTGPCMSRPAVESWPTATPKANTRRAATRHAPSSGRPRRRSSSPPGRVVPTPRRHRESGRSIFY